MNEQFKKDMIKVITEAIEEDYLDDNDASAILDICGKASERRIANLTEDYLNDRIEGGIQ